MSPFYHLTSTQFPKEIYDKLIDITRTLYHTGNTPDGI